MHAIETVQLVRVIPTTEMGRVCGLELCSSYISAKCYLYIPQFRTNGQCIIQMRLEEQTLGPAVRTAGATAHVPTQTAECIVHFRRRAADVRPKMRSKQTGTEIVRQIVYRCRIALQEPVQRIGQL